MKSKVPAAKSRRQKKKNSAKKAESETKISDVVSNANVAEQGLTYLEEWKNRSEPGATWKFKKVRQLWLIRWMYHSDVISKANFKTVLEYLSGMDEGHARQRVLKEAQDFVAQWQPQEPKEDAPDVEQHACRLQRRRYKRALLVLKTLS